MKETDLTGEEPFNEEWSFRERLLWYEKKRILEQVLPERPSLRDSRLEYVKNFVKPRASKNRESHLEAASEYDYYSELAGIRKSSVFGEGKAFAVRSATKLKAPIDRPRFRKIHFLLQVDPEHFLLKPEEENAWFKENSNEPRDKYFTIEFWNTIKAFWPKKKGWNYLESFFHHNRTFNEPLQKSYNAISSYFRSAKYHITVHEVLFKGDNEKPGRYKAYRDAQKLVHSAIMDAIKRHSANDEDFRYKRVFHLSSSEHLFPKGNKDDQLRAFMAEASLQTLEHILTCLKNHSKYCSFHVVGRSSSLRHRAVIDDEWMFVEDYAFDNGLTTPERLIIHDITPKSQAADFLTHFKAMVYEYTTVEISLLSFKAHLDDAYEYAVKQEESRKAALRQLDSKRPEFIKLRERIDSTKQKFTKQKENKNLSKSS